MTVPHCIPALALDADSPNHDIFLPSGLTGLSVYLMTALHRQDENGDEDTTALWYTVVSILLTWVLLA